MHIAPRMILVFSVLFAGCAPQVDSAGSPPASSPEQLSGDPDACTSGVLGDGSCVEPGVFKLQATNDVCAPGLFLSDFQLDAGSCEGGLFVGATFTCCPPPPYEPPPPKEPGTGGTCVENKIGVDACTDISALEAQAGDTCSADSRTLVDRKFFGDDCADGQATGAWFTCCAPATP